MTRHRSRTEIAVWEHDDAYLLSAVKNTRVPTKITLDAYAASHRAVREMQEEGELPRRVKVRSSQYLNNHCVANRFWCKLKPTMRSVKLGLVA